MTKSIEPALHQLDDAAAKPGRRHARRRRVSAIVVSCSGSSILSVKMRHGLAQARGVECLKALVDQMAAHRRCRVGR